MAVSVYINLPVERPLVTLSRTGAALVTLHECWSVSKCGQLINAIFWLYLMKAPGFPLKLGIPILYTIALLIPLTSQFFIPATPVFSWLITFYSSQFTPVSWRPTISVALLPALESVLYGANISDILTRVTHPVLDVIAWLPYGVLHFVVPFVVAAFSWLFRPKEVLHLWAQMFGVMMLTGVVIQILFPCAAPWYELIYGLTPADYSMHGSAGGLARIDAIFGSNGYGYTFANAPVIFGAFPSLHAGNATLIALFLSHFFPQSTRYIWGYAGVLYWATMYLTHHYLIDVVVGACLATAVFHLYLPDEFRGPGATAPPGGLRQRSKYEIYDLDAPRRGNGRANGGLNEEDFDLASDTSSHPSDEEVDITFRSPNPAAGAAANDQQPKSQPPRKKDHRHTASIASLIRADERAEDGWSPIRAGFALPSPQGEEMRR
ncbi:PAP2-domain-containing protein [Athelia psychrophila]|uniref:PAP2-domain-containing protein n=1 Tax=Athelia psychrophila TaxID=1759441 RepID=A0A166LF55_9AGAM|nr:PAP2-domain-containing protein [Fibularhizoctonia sp. CBS 109695]